tara:strand:- start:1239 stop:1490 length:252 start_codon:yes stop_codon:yes gene_type:complete
MQRPLHEEVRPRHNRDELGERGELFAKLADVLETYVPDVTVQAGISLQERAAAVALCFVQVPELQSEECAQKALVALRERAAQ